MCRQEQENIMYDANHKIGVIGLGYVGAPLCAAFGTKYQTLGFDINVDRVNSLRQGIDLNGEIDPDDIKNSIYADFSSDANQLANCNVFIITVPTPIDSEQKPDLSHVINATHLVAQYLKYGDIVIYESTVYPGATEEECVPVLEAVSGLAYNKDFFCGYSPERINPGDKKRSVKDIVKVTSGSNSATASIVDNLYKSIIQAGTFQAQSIKVAEAAKVIENTQRDVNIALMNELALIFYKLGIDTKAVIDAASTKWNFLAFTPGLVGGHCIGIDPYYIAHKAIESGARPDLILSSRNVNENFPKSIANLFLERLINSRVKLSAAKILVLGAAFKEDCADIRNSKVFDVIRELSSFVLEVDAFDPIVNEDDLDETVPTNVKFVSNIKHGHYDGVFLAVPHKCFIENPEVYVYPACKPGGIIFDLKARLPKTSNVFRI